MPTAKRAIVLKALCDIRLNCGDIMQRIEEAVNVTKMNPKKREALLKGQGRKGAALVEVLDDFRRQPLGTDSSGRVYWWLDFWETTGSRLYRHTPGTRRKKALDASPGSWEFLGSTPDDLQNVSQELVRSRKKPDRQLVSAIDTVVVEMSERIEAEERRRRARARLRLDVGVILDNGESRSRRARRDVKYTFDDFDEMIGAALREGRRSRNQSQPGRERREASPIKYDIGSRGPPPVSGERTATMPASRRAQRRQVTIPTGAGKPWARVPASVAAAASQSSPLSQKSMVRARAAAWAAMAERRPTPIQFRTQPQAAAGIAAPLCHLQRRHL
uniref:Ddt domain-containing protein n=1 Tax=Tetraselmis sp. GSL018 TaxID=582737 RepID=A0A061QM56_9CHLO